MKNENKKTNKQHNEDKQKKIIRLWYVQCPPKTVKWISHKWRCMCIRLKFFFHSVFTVRIWFSLEFCLLFFSVFALVHLLVIYVSLGLYTCCIWALFFCVCMCSRVSSFSKFHRKNLPLVQICALRTAGSNALTPTENWNAQTTRPILKKRSNESKTINRMNGTCETFRQTKRIFWSCQTKSIGFFHIFFFGPLTNTSMHNDISKSTVSACMLLFFASYVSHKASKRRNLAASF